MLGNKQLLSVFFFIVVLLAVFFIMGYMVGRSTGGDLANKRSGAEPMQRTDSTSAMPPRGASTAENKPLEVPQVTKSEAPQETTTPADAAPSQSPSASVPVSPTPANPAAGTKSEGSKPLEVTPVTTSVTQPGPGTYVQVSAPMKAEGELIVEVLTKKGFHALLAPGPDDKRYRVLVGPLKDASDTGKAIADLEKLGFKGAFPRRY